MKDFIQSHLTQWVNAALPILPRLGYALLIFLLGMWTGKRIANIVEKYMKKSKHIDPTIISFSSNMTRTLLVIIVVLAALNQLGVQTSSIIAMLAAAGLGVAMSLKNSLSNLASGFLMVFFRPFSVGQAIDINGILGNVEEINLLFTRILTYDKQVVVVPNDTFMRSATTNYGDNNVRRGKVSFGVSYSDDIDKVKSVVMDVVAKFDVIMDEPAPYVYLDNFGDSSINLALLYFTPTPDYWQTIIEVREGIKKAFDANGITIPFPQCDVHMVESEKATQS